ARHALANALELRVGQLLDLAIALHTRRDADRLRARPADAVDRRQRDVRVLVIGYVDACNACHREPEIIAVLTRPYSALTLFVARILADHPHHALAPHDLALAADLLHRRHHFHLALLLGAEDNSSARQVVRREFHRDLVAGQDADVVHPHLSRDMSQHYVSVLQLHPKGRIRQVVHDLALYLDH